MEQRHSRTSFTVQDSAPVEVAGAFGKTPEWNVPASLVWGQQTKHFQMAFKRILDIAVASVLLLILAVPLMLVATAIKIDSPGPVFFPDNRIGHKGRRFRMLKFRSMFVDAKAAKKGLIDQNDTDAPLFKMRNDPRRTRVGHLIRRFSIDEFPQLLNVLLGDMSLVGPRPFVPDEVSEHSHWRLGRLLAVPGMTGLWQVSGRSALPFEELVELDLSYVNRWSLWLDLVILLRTVPAVISGKGAY